MGSSDRFEQQVHTKDEPFLSDLNNSTKPIEVVFYLTEQIFNLSLPDIAWKVPHVYSSTWTAAHFLFLSIRNSKKAIQETQIIETKKRSQVRK